MYALGILHVSTIPYIQFHWSSLTLDKSRQQSVKVEQHSNSHLFTQQHQSLQTGVALWALCSIWNLLTVEFFYLLWFISTKLVFSIYRFLCLICSSCDKFSVLILIKKTYSKYWSFSLELSVYKFCIINYTMWNV